jgi:hypothetical protein
MVELQELMLPSIWRASESGVEQQMSMRATTISGRERAEEEVERRAMTFLSSWCAPTRLISLVFTRMSE